MSKQKYRKITVGHQEFEYLVGKCFVSVRGVGVVQKSEIGYVKDERIVDVTPKHVADYIRSKTQTQLYQKKNNRK